MPWPNAGGGGGTVIVNTTNITNISQITQATGFKALCDYATAAALPACTYANGTAGVGATLTASANGALTVDGVVQTANNRILVKNQVAALQNGIYVVSQVGTGSLPWILTRSDDFDGSSTGTVDSNDLTGAFNTVAGTTNNDTLWISNPSVTPFVFGTSTITWSQVTGNTTIFQNTYGKLVVPTFDAAMLSLKPVLYWKLNEANNAATVKDYSGNGLTGTVSTVTSGDFGNAGVVPSDTETSFQSNANYIQTTGYPAALPSGNAAWTLVACWRNGPTAGPGTAEIVSMGTQSTASQVADLGFGSNQLFASNFGGNLGPTFALSDAKSLVGFSYDGEQVRTLWLNAQPVAAGLGVVTPLNIAGTGTPHFYANRGSDGSPGHGFLGRVACFSRELNAKEWRQLMNSFTGIV